MSKVVITVTDKPSGAEADLKIDFDPPYTRKGRPTQAQSLAMMMLEAIRPHELTSCETDDEG